MPNPKKKYTIEEARAFAKKNPEAFNKALDKINPDPYRGFKKFAELLINQYPDRFKGLKPESFLSMMDSIAQTESGNQNIAQKSINPRTKKQYDGPARGYFQIETSTAPIAQKRYQNYQDILKPLTAVPLPDIKVPTSGDVRSLSRDEQARLALANMSATAAAKKEKLNPLDSQNSWLNFHWNGSPADKPARQQHWKETFGYGGGGAVGGKLRNQVEPTRADSLDLLNNTKSLENYYSKYNKSYSSAQDASEVNVHYLNKNSADTFFTSGASVKVPRKDGTSMDLKRELFPKDQYYKKVDNNRYYQRELADRILDTRAPMALYDKRIAPNNLTAYLNDIPNDGMNGDGITIYGYDPLSVTPWDMLNSKDKANRISQFGIAGTPYKSVEEFQKANPAPVIQARKNNLEKMPIINKPLSISNNQQINPDSNVTVPKFQPYTASNNPNIARGYYDLGQGKKIETFQDGGKMIPQGEQGHGRYGYKFIFDTPKTIYTNPEYNFDGFRRTERIEDAEYRGVPTQEYEDFSKELEKNIQEQKNPNPLDRFLKPGTPTYTPQDTTKRIFAGDGISTSPLTQVPQGYFLNTGQYNKTPQDYGVYSPNKTYYPGQNAAKGNIEEDYTIEQMLMPKPPLGYYAKQLTKGWIKADPALVPKVESMVKGAQKSEKLNKKILDRTLKTQTYEKEFKGDISKFDRRTLAKEAKDAYDPNALRGMTKKDMSGHSIYPAHQVPLKDKYKVGEWEIEKPSKFKKIITLGLPDDSDRLYKAASESDRYRNQRALDLNYNAKKDFRQKFDKPYEVTSMPIMNKLGGRIKWTLI